MNYTAADIEKYWKGRMTAAEMRTLEKAAMEDPFLADALEGYRNHPEAAAMLSDLEAQLEARTGGAGSPVKMAPTRSHWWRIAASVVLITGAGILAYSLLTGKRQENVATLNSPASIPESEKKSIPAITKDSVVDKDDQASVNQSVTPSEPVLNTPPIDSRKKPAAVSDTVLQNVNEGVAVTAAEEFNKSDSTSVTSSFARPPTSKATEKNEEVLTKNDGAGKAPAVEDKRLTENAIKTDDPSGRSVIRDNNAAPAKNLADSKTKKEKQLYWSGRVVDADNNAIPYANVANLMNNQITQSNIQGYFSVPVSSDSLVLLNVTSNGYYAREFRLNRFERKTNELVLLPESYDEGPGELRASAEPYEPALQKGEMITYPEPEHGWVLYNQYIANSLTSHKEDLISGEVILSFTVSKSGNPVNIIISQTLTPENDKEALRLLQEGPKWVAKGKTNAARIIIRFH